MAATLMDSLKKSIGKKKAKSQAFAWLADLERAAGDLDTSMQRLNGGLTIYQNDVPAMLVRSKIFFEKGEFEDCISECEKVLKFDPFCLSAQKRMGDAYEQLGNENERNKCYRRVHDMDPLDTFWKDEYENVVEDVASAAIGMSEVDFAMPDDFDTPSDFGANENSVATEEAPVAEPTAEAGLDLSQSFDGESLPQEEELFASLSSLLPNEDAGEEAAMESLQESLDTAMAEMANDEPSSPEVFPTDEEVSGGDVESALSSMFGVIDDVEPEAPASPFAKLDLPASLKDKPVDDAKSVQDVFGGAAEEDKPQSVDSAFSSIFGDDELPEEKPLASKPAEEDKPQSVDSAFSSIFGDDELPEEKPLAAKPLEEDKPQSVDSAFSSIFGDDELPEEKPSFGEGTSLFEKSASADATFEKSESLSSLFEKSADADIEMPSDLLAEPVAEQPLAEPAIEEQPLAEPAAEKPAFVVEGNMSVFDEPAVEEKPATQATSGEGNSFNVDNAFDALFGESDDLPEEKPAQSAAPVSAPVVDVAEAAPKAPVEEPAPAAGNDLAQEMGGAFASIFGTDDDLDFSDAKTASAAPSSTPSQEDTGAAIEESLVPEVSLKSDLDKSFDSLFGMSEDKDEPQETTSTPKTVAPAAAPAPVETNSLQNEIDGAFKGLFDMDEDLLPEDNASNKKGVDFLMSDDSDDEVSNGLIKDPSAPLERGATDLDESLNTKTLAEIYFEQGLYGKALDIYEDLARKEPNNVEITNRLMEIEKVYREKFGGDSNG